MENIDGFSYRGYKISVHKDKYEVHVSEVRKNDFNGEVISSFVTGNACQSMELATAFVDGINFITKEQ